MKKVPKIFILSAILCIVGAQTPAWADFTGRIEVGSVQAEPGGKAVVPVYLYDNNIDIMAMSIPLHYSSAALAVDSVSFAGSLLKPNMTGWVNNDHANQFLRITYAPVSGLPLISEASGLLANIHFAVSAAASDQTVEVDSVYRLDYVGPPQLWVRLEVADSSGLNLFFPGFSAGIVEVKSSTDADDGGPIRPLVLELKQNYPNPFNPSTIISYSLPERSHVSLKVFNILGQQVAALVDETRDAGEYEEIWEPEGMASGIYFYRLAVNSSVLTKKMTLLK